MTEINERLKALVSDLSDIAEKIEAKAKELGPEMKELFEKSADNITSIVSNLTDEVEERVKKFRN